MKPWILILMIGAYGCSTLKTGTAYNWAIMDFQPPTDVLQLPGPLRAFPLVKSDIKAAEQILNEVYALNYAGHYESSPPLHEFCRQYYGFVNEQNEQLIFHHLF